MGAALFIFFIKKNLYCNLIKYENAEVIDQILTIQRQVCGRIYYVTPSCRKIEQHINENLLCQ